jgi:hypothetical protein
MKSAIHPVALLATAGAVALLSLPAFAQHQTNDMPPELEQIDELKGPATPAVTTREVSPARSGGRQIIEKRERGQVTSIEVRSGENSYYIDPGDETGTITPGTVQGESTRAPQWKIFEFDLKRPVEANNDAAPQAAPAAPPAPVRPAPVK